MTPEEFVFTLLNNDPELKSIGVQKLYRSNAPDNPEHDCFINLVWGTSGHVMPEDPVAPRDLTAWVYDTPGYYGNIDHILFRLRQLLTQQVAPQVGWFGDSGDLYDDKYARVLRTGTYTVH